MSLFSGMKGAKRNFQSAKLLEGNYFVRIDNCETFETDISGNCYKILLTILAVNDGPHKEGEVLTVVYGEKSAQTKANWYGNIKGFIGNVMGVTDEAVGEAETVATLTKELGGENVLGGTVCLVKAMRRTSKKNRDEKGEPREFSVYNWGIALEPQEIAQVLGPERVKRFFPNGL